MPSYDALLFDFDGVLADTERHHHQSWNTVLKPHGIQFTWEEYLAQCVGIADPKVAERLQLPDPGAAVAQKQKLFREALAASPPFLEETLDLVRDLAQNHRLAVVSSSFRGEILPPIQKAGLEQYFERIICGDDVARLKPCPDPYLLAADTMQLRTPLVIEDSAAGIAAGEAAGFEVLRITAVDRMAEQVRAHLAASRG